MQEMTLGELLRQKMNEKLDCPNCEPIKESAVSKMYTILDFMFDLGANKVDTVALLRLMASVEPEFVLKCATNTGPDFQMRAMVREHIARGEWVQAIKNVRNEKGWGLKEAKDWCDTVRDEVEPGWRSRYA